MNKKLVLAMAFSRNTWVTKFRQRFEGTLKEYTKIHLVKKLHLKNFWDKEVTTLSKKLLELFDPKITKQKGNWDLYKAAAEAFLEASGEQIKCKEALHDFKHYGAYSNKEIKEIYKYYSEEVPDSLDLSLEILEKYFPKEISNKIFQELQRKM